MNLSFPNLYVEFECTNALAYLFVYHLKIILVTFIKCRVISINTHNTFKSNNYRIAKNYN